MAAGVLPDSAPIILSRCSHAKAVQVPADNVSGMIGTCSSCLPSRFLARRYLFVDRPLALHATLVGLWKMNLLAMNFSKLHRLI